MRIAPEPAGMQSTPILATSTRSAESQRPLLSPGHFVLAVALLASIVSAHRATAQQTIWA